MGKYPVKGPMLALKDSFFLFSFHFGKSHSIIKLSYIKHLPVVHDMHLTDEKKMNNGGVGCGSFCY